MEWIKQILESADFGLAILPASLLLGFLTAFSSCCNLGIIAAVAGFAGGSGIKGQSYSRREAILMATFFLLGTTLALAGLGLLVGYFGQFVGENWGRYGLVITGFIAILFGLTALNLIPFKLPSINIPDKFHKGGIAGAAIFGLGVGIASVSCTLACSGPILPVVLGIAAAKGETVWGAIILTMFAIGYSLPMALLMLGIGLGKVTTLAQKAVKPIRIIAGSILIIVGFWLIFTA